MVSFYVSMMQKRGKQFPSRTLIKPLRSLVGTGPLWKKNLAKTSPFVNILFCLNYRTPSNGQDQTGLISYLESLQSSQNDLIFFPIQGCRILSMMHNPGIINSIIIVISYKTTEFCTPSSVLLLLPLEFPHPLYLWFWKPLMFSSEDF